MNYVIVGAGPAGVIAAETLRRMDAGASIQLIGDEPEPPYSRMAIPYCLIDRVAEEGTYLRKSDRHFESLNIEVVNDRVLSVSPTEGSVALGSGTTISYDRLLVATGSTPISPPIEGMDLPGVYPCWTLADYRNIAARADKGAKVVLMGAGFIGCIILEALAARGVDLTVVELENRMVPRMMNEASGGLIKRWCEQRGVRVLTSTRVEGITGGDPLAVSLSNGETLTANLVISATGVAPNIQFLEGSGVDVDQGIVVNECLESSVANLFAAGDVAQGRDFSTGDYTIQAIQPTAVDHGRVVASNMTSGHEQLHRGSLNMNVLDAAGVPGVMNLKQVLRAFLDHRLDVLLRRTANRLKHIAHRLEVLGGYLVAYLNLDEVICIIREAIHGNGNKAECHESDAFIPHAYLFAQEY